MENSFSPTASDRSEQLVIAVLDRLLAADELSESSLDRALRASESSHERIDVVLAKLGLVTEDALVAHWSAVTGLDIIAPQNYPRSQLELESISSEFLTFAGILPIARDDGRLILAVTDPLDDFAHSALAIKLGCQVTRVIARPGELSAAFSRLYGDTHGEMRNLEKTQGAWSEDVVRLRDLASDAPVIRLVNHIIDRAVELRASDIHLTATELGSRVRVRVDGVLQDLPTPPSDLHPALVSRLKIMAGLDIAERRLPQDGRIRIGWRGRELDLRVATIPHIYGEGIVLRILDRATAVLELARLGFSAHVASGLRKVIAEPSGIFLVTGPTGSGKTTTLYAVLRDVARPDRNVVTVEDPIEYHLPDVNQIQIHRRIGLDFATTLRAVLRHDPDVIMVGEIRDRETAAVAIQAALTGHLVVATMHTNTAAAALPRLLDMGIEPFLLASTIRGSMAQRLVRQLCTKCRRPIIIETKTIPGALIEGAAPNSGAFEAYESVGCDDCRDTGYTGRVAIAELMLMDDPIRALLLEGSDETTITRTAVSAGMRTLLADGMEKVVAGQTSLKEVLRVIGGSES